MFAGLAWGQGTPDDGLTDSTEAIQRVLDTGRVHIAGDPLGAGAQVTALVADGKVTGFRVDAAGSRYCKVPEIRMEGGASGVAEIDAGCRLKGIRLGQGGDGYKAAPRVLVIPHPRCYKVTQLRLPRGAVVEGDGKSTCLIPGDPLKPVLFSEGEGGLHLRDFVVTGRGNADIGMQFNGSFTGDATLSTLQNVEVSGFREKNIELNQSYGFVLENVHSHSSGGWGLYLRDGYNNATQIISGEYSGNRTGGVYVGAHSTQFHFSSIAESNGLYGIYYRGPSHGLVIDDAYFEGNGRDGQGFDVRGEFNDYDWPTRGLTIRNSLFNSGARTEGAALLENTVDIDFSHNTGMPPMLGEAYRKNVVRIGKGAANLRFDGNTGLAVRSGAGSPINTEIPPDAVNLFRQPLPAVVRLPVGSGAANITTVQRQLAVAPGHMIGAGAWMKTDSGTATVWVEIANGSVVYTGTDLNQPHRQTIGPEWQWISIDIGTDVGSAAKTTRAAFRIYRNDDSFAKAVYIRSAIAWRDVAAVGGRPK